MSDSNLETTDWLLGQLEAIARNADPQNLFYRRLIEALVPILQSECVLLATQIESKPLSLYFAGNRLEAPLLEEGLAIAFSEPIEHELQAQRVCHRSHV